MSAVAALDGLYDVFISYAVSVDPEVAAAVRKAFEAAGLKVFDSGISATGTRAEDAIWHALAVSNAVVVLASAHNVKSSWTAVEIGAAMAWHKPIFVVRADDVGGPLPDYLVHLPIIPVARINDVVQSVKKSLKPMTAADRNLLTEIYLKMGVPTDQLIQNPKAVDELASRFNERKHTTLSGEKLVQELINMRKGSALPKLRRA